MDATFKLCIFGDGGVGKTSLVNRYLTGVFAKNTSATIGVGFHIKKLNFKGFDVSLQIWDFAGEQKYRELLPNYVLGAQGGIFMFDLTRYSSLKNLSEWLNIFDGTVRRQEFQIPVILVGGKSDLELNRSISEENALEIAKYHNLHQYFECSSKLGLNINPIFIELTRVMLENARML